MGYDDLKVIEAKKFLQSVTQGLPGACTIDDAQSAAEVVSAAVTSADTGSWVKVPAVPGATYGGEPATVGAGGDARSGPWSWAWARSSPTWSPARSATGSTSSPSPPRPTWPSRWGDRPRRRGGRRRVPRPHTADAGARPDRGGHRPGRPRDGHGPRHRGRGHPRQRHPSRRGGRPRARPGPGQAGGSADTRWSGRAGGRSGTAAARSATWTARRSGSSATAGSAVGSGSSPRRSGCGCSPTTRSPRRPPRWRAPTSTSWWPRATCSPCTCRSPPENHHMVNAAFLGPRQAGAVLINCGRGGLLDLDAALAALESGQLSGSASTCSSPSPRCTTRSSTTRACRSPRT